ncbi:MAG: hypothetical protein KKD44_08580 [Proteobacteria bacterium]|nr:hypothetical protein [Pseudomonadota bacterium]
MHIGIDFDNTIVNYDSVFFRFASEQGLIGKGFKPNKEMIRDHIRMRHGGEILWQKLQAIVYYHKMNHAELMKDADVFIRECKRRQIKISIVSHKTKFAAQDKRANLQEAALNWMTENRFFDREVFGLNKENVFFESTRQQKIECISKIGCTHFIDDLIDVLEDPAFPDNVKKIHFNHNSTEDISQSVRHFSSWLKIKTFLFEESI